MVEKDQPSSFYDEFMMNLPGMIVNHQAVHKYEPPEYGKRQVIANTIGAIVTLRTMNDINDDQVRTAIEYFNTLTGWGVTYESLFPDQST